MRKSRFKKFRQVDYLWDEVKAKTLKNDLELFLYRSNLLGTDLRITNFGGGNTSCKTLEKHPLTGEAVEVMWIKGSGGDLGTLKRSGIAGLYTDRIRDLKKVYRGLEHEDEMVKLLYHCIYDLDSRAPSIDTPLHGLLPFKHIDHLHPDAVIAVAASKDGQKITKEIWGDQMGWVDWRRPGFQLALEMETCLQENPGIRGMVLGSHGLFTWGDTSYDCYLNSLETIEQASRYLSVRQGKKRPVFGGAKIKSLPNAQRFSQATKIAPVLRGLCSSQRGMIGHFTDDERVLEFMNSKDLNKLAKLGTSCPDHFLRTKIQPLIIRLKPEENLDDFKAIKPKLDKQFEEYRNAYSKYYEGCKDKKSPPMRDPNPVVLLYPGVGMFTFAKNKQTARVASEFYINAINVMRGSEAVSRYTALSRQEAFNIEYWELEEAKLRRQPPERPLSRRIALVTGAGGGIGHAIAQKFVEEGANVLLTDLNESRLISSDLIKQRDKAAYITCDVTDPGSVQHAFDQACLEFGGVDIIVHSAGLAISKKLEDTTPEDWNLLQEVLVTGQFNLAKTGVEIMRRQGLGGDIVNIASKNGLVAGPNNVGYGTAKAAQQHMTRLLAAELGKDHIRVNTVNPDGVIIGSKIWEGAWAKGRAKAYGIKVKDLPDHYAKRNLLQEKIRPEDIAKAVFSLVAILDKSTGNVINVDGGMPEAFVR